MCIKLYKFNLYKYFINFYVVLVWISVIFIKRSLVFNIENYERNVYDGLNNG